MSATVKAALIVATGIVLASALYAFNSPYHKCVRGLEAGDVESKQAHLLCARELNGTVR